MKTDKSSTSLMSRKGGSLRKVSFSRHQLERDISEGEFTVASAWKNFKNFTTSHGIAHIDHAKGKFKKSIWVFFTVLCFVGLCFNLFLLISKYLEYNVDVSIKIEQAKAMAFPAVTICNNNPIKKSYFDKNENFKQILIEYRNEVFAKNCSLLGGNLHTSSLAKRTSMAECFPTFGLTEDGRKQRSDFRLLNLIQESLISMEESQTLEAGHDKYDMIFDCEFSGGMCSLEEDFTYSFNNYYGNCYTFNSDINSNGSKMSRRAGPRYGLSITFNVEQHEYVGEISQSAGLRVVVHDPMRMPFPEDDAILVSPNALTHIGVTMVKNMKLNGSYGDCYAEGLKKRTVYQEMFNLSYCEKGCQYTCLSKEITRRCSCCYAKFAITKNRDPSLKPCAQDNDTQRMCVDSVWTSYENGQLQCDPKCPIPCRETLFKVAVSSDIWPSKSYLTYLSSFLRNSAYETSEELDNYGKFVVYIENLAYETISETPAYEMHQLLSDIGGVLGLYIGFSLLTLVEFLELLYDMCRVAINLALKNFYERTKRPQTSPKT